LEVASGILMCCISMKENDLPDRSRKDIHSV